MDFESSFRQMTPCSTSAEYLDLLRLHRLCKVDEIRFIADANQSAFNFWAIHPKL